MDKTLNEQELVDYIVGQTKATPQNIRLVLKHEQAFIENAHQGAKGDIDIDSDDLVDYVMSRKDVKLDELTVENILDAEMEYLTKKGFVSYMD